MPARRRLLRLATILVSITSVHAFVRLPAPNTGNNVFWPSPTVQYYINQNGTTDIPGNAEITAVNAGFASWGSIASSDLFFQYMGTNPAGFVATDSINIVIWLDDAAGEFAAVPDIRAFTRVRRDPSTGQMFEADVALNGVNFSWSTSSDDAFTSSTGPMDVQAVIAHESGHLAGLDHVTARNAAMFPFIYAGDTTPRTLSQDEISAAQAIFPPAGAPADTTISGSVTRSGGTPVKRAIAVAFQGGLPIVSAMTDASGNYILRRVPPGNYQVRVQPYSNSATVTLSAYFQSAANVDIAFLGEIYNNVVRENTGATVTATTGTNTPNINFEVTASGNQDDPFEQDDSFGTAQAIPVTGLAHLKHSWPSADQDWVSFAATVGRLYVIETRNLGLQPDASGSFVDSATILTLYDQTGANVLGASNASPNDLEQVNGSRIVRSETASATRYVKVVQRTASNVGGHTYYDLSVRELTGPFSAPIVTTVGPSQATEDGGIVVTVRGMNFLPGAEVSFGGSAGTIEDAQECLTPTDCRAIKVQVPSHAPGAVTVQVTNVDGQSGSLASGFTYTARAIGKFANATFGAFIPGEFVGQGSVLCWGDFDKDGDPDLYQPFQSTTFTGSSVRGELFRNNGDGTFANITAAAGLNTAPPTRSTCAWVDYDNDGDLDLFVATAASSGVNNNLWRNNGNATFTDVAATPALIAGDSAASKTDGGWADYDLDGDMDLYLTYTNATRPNQLFRNNGAGVFADVAVAAKVALQSQSGRAIWGDYDNDGFPDLYVVNRSGVADVLYHNDGGTFSDVTASAGIVEASNCFDATWGNLNADIYLDLFCVGNGTIANPNRLWLNNGNGTFSESAAVSAVATLNQVSQALAVLDKDNDGDVDVYVGNAGPSPPRPEMLLENNGANPPVFANVAVASGIDETSFPRSGNAVACADYNLDNFVDALVTGAGSFFDDAYLWRNSSNTNDSVTIRLEGSISNKWGIGASVEVIGNLGGAPSAPACQAATGQRREVIGGSRNQNSIELEFGLGPRPIDQRRVDCVKVTWPRSGLKQVFTDVAVNQVLVVSETAPDLTLTKVAPVAGTTGGGTQVTLTGFGFDSASAVVRIGGTVASVVNRVGTNFITVTAPPHAAGSVSVSVTNPGPNPPADQDSIAAAFTYVAPGTDISILGQKQQIANSAVFDWVNIGLDRYRVLRATSPSPSAFETGTVTSVATNQYVDRTLGNGTSYYYLVVGGNCGNGTLDPAETCEGANLGGQTCPGLGFSGGTLDCTTVCTFDVSACTP